MRLRLGVKGCQTHTHCSIFEMSTPQLLHGRIIGQLVSKRRIFNDAKLLSGLGYFRFEMGRHERIYAGKI